MPNFIKIKVDNLMIYNTRGFLSNYPPGVVMIIKGRPVTKLDILDGKRARQRRELATKRRSYEPIIKPCFVWTFYNRDMIYGGWWLYVQTLHQTWRIGTKRRPDLCLKAMRLFPCGFLPMIENFEQWKPAFATTYPRQTVKRPDNQGMAIAWAKIDMPGKQLLDIQQTKRKEKDEKAE